MGVLRKLIPAICWGVLEAQNSGWLKMVRTICWGDIGSSKLRLVLPFCSCNCQEHIASEGTIGQVPSHTASERVQTLYLSVFNKEAFGGLFPTATSWVCCTKCPSSPNKDRCECPVPFTLIAAETKDESRRGAGAEGVRKNMSVQLECWWWWLRRNKWLWWLSENENWDYR